jgi:predicted transport protein
MLKRKSFFEMLMIKKLGEKVAKSIAIDWKNPRVICIAESYSKFDIDTAEIIPIKIELLKYRFYQDDIFSLEPLSMSYQKEKSETVGIEKPVVDCSVDELLMKADENTKQLFEKLREMIFVLDENIKEKSTSYYVAYRITKNLAEIHIQKNKLKIHLRPINYDDPKRIVEKIPEGYNWTMNRRVFLKSENELEYVLGLIEQSYKDVL